MSEFIGHGITRPLSDQAPTQEEIKANEVMMHHLMELGEQGEALFETSDGDKEREVVKNKIETLVKSWVSELGRKKGIDEALLEDGGGARLYIFGSQRLGVHNSSSDIDMLGVVPQHVSRDEFFSLFVPILGARSDVSLALPIPEAYTPVVKFHLNDQAVDMLVVTLAQPIVPKDLDILDAACLQGLDVQGMRCMNGPRVAESILKLVPNTSTYATALRVIKYWARQRGLYSNVLGFLGGVNFAIMVAFVCQRYPKATASALVKRFFNLFCQWHWPAPVMLNAIDDPRGMISTLLPVWNPKVDPKDRSHLMPIITPAYPAMNSAYNIGGPQFRLIVQEMQRAQTICYAAQDNNDNDAEAGRKLWVDLLTSSAREFFTRHPRYVQVDLIGRTTEQHRMWFGWCESRMRQLFLSLDQPPHVYAHPLATCFHREVFAEGVISQMLKGGAADEIPAGAGVGSVVEAQQMPSSLSSSSSSSPPSSSTPPASSSPSSLSTPPSQTEGGLKILANQDVREQRALGEDSSEVLYLSSFFIGMAVNAGVKHVDVSQQMLGFVHRISNWAKHRSGMDVRLNIHSMDTVPAFVRHEDTIKAPSGTSGCTPKRSRRFLNGISSGATSPIPEGRSPSLGSPRENSALSVDFADLMISATSSTPVKK